MTTFNRAQASIVITSLLCSNLNGVFTIRKFSRQHFEKECKLQPWCKLVKGQVNQARDYSK
jgi:hypothetical protein